MTTGGQILAAHVNLRQSALKHFERPRPLHHYRTAGIYLCRLDE